jgi:hypothetical protein
VVIFGDEPDFEGRVVGGGGRVRAELELTGVWVRGSGFTTLMTKTESMGETTPLRRILIAACVAAVAAAPAAASGALRLRLKPGRSLSGALHNMEQSINRRAGFSGVDCWMWDGNARIGWRHGSCVGSYNHDGYTYRFKLTATPVSCTKIRYLIVVPAQGSQVEYKPHNRSSEWLLCGS